MIRTDFHAAAVADSAGRASRCLGALTHVGASPDPVGAVYQCDGCGQFLTVAGGAVVAVGDDFPRDNGQGAPVLARMGLTPQQLDQLATLPPDLGGNGWADLRLDLF